MSASYITANGLPVIEARIALPRVGVWHADLVVDTQAEPAGPVTISAADGALTLSGTQFRGGVARDILFTRVVAGQAGLGRVAPARAYRGVPVQLVLRDILAAAGEQLSAAANPGALAIQLDRWSVLQQSCGAAVNVLFQHPALAGMAWRFLSDGSFWTGPETWAEAPNDFDLEDDEPHLNRATVFLFSPTLLPGMTFLDRKVSYVVHNFSADLQRTQVWFE